MLNDIIKLAKITGEIILRTPNAIIEHKKDNSPLTKADLAAHEAIVKGLMQINPTIPILSEERVVPVDERKDWQEYWCVDPIDGTKEFLKNSPDYTVNIALIKNKIPVQAVVYLPKLNILYYADEPMGAFKEENNEKIKLTTKPFSQKTLNIAASCSHGPNMEDAIKKITPDFNIIKKGSSYKFCLVAENLADIYPRLAPTAFWDTAAAQCILTQAGGRVFDLSGNDLCYDPSQSLKNPAFLAVADANFNWQNYLSIHKW